MNAELQAQWNALQEERKELDRLVSIISNPNRRNKKYLVTYTNWAEDVASITVLAPRNSSARVEAKRQLKEQGKTNAIILSTRMIKYDKNRNS
jgi:hypothetical protein